MNRDHRYVFDTNVIVSALLFNESVPGQAFFRAIEAGTKLLFILNRSVRVVFAERSAITDALDQHFGTA